MGNEALNQLEDFLKSAFSVFEMRQILHQRYGQSVIGALPPELVKPDEFFYEVRLLLERKGWVRDVEIYKAIRERCPGREQDLRAVLSALQVVLPRAAPSRGVAPPPPEVDWEKEPYQQGRFRPREEIGSGLFATVHKVWDLNMGRWCALKVLHPSLARDAARSARDRFHREAALMAEFEHPHILRIFDMFVEEKGDLPVIVMPFIEGGSLARRLEKGGKFSTEEAVARICEVLSALAYVHQRGVVHCDIRPHNLLMGPKGQLLVCDFGVARVLDDQTLRGMTTVGGGVGFKAPEQSSDPKSISARTDLYCVAVTLMSMLRGDALGGDLSNPNAYKQILKGIPEVLLPILKRAGAYEAGDRYSSAEEMVKALRDALSPPVPLPEVKKTQPAPLPVNPSPPPRPERPAVEVVKLPGNIELKLAPIPGGSFLMGSPPEEEGRFDDEGPQHRVTVSSFWMGVFPVTQGEWTALMEENPSDFKGDPRLPVEGVSWWDAVVFCNRLSLQAGKRPVYFADVNFKSPLDKAGTLTRLAERFALPTGRSVFVDWEGEGYRLPTEAEWEYACRAGTVGAYNNGEVPSGSAAPPSVGQGRPGSPEGLGGVTRGGFTRKGSIAEVAWYDENSSGRPHPVGEKASNRFGLYDMHGNVWEWCWDWKAPYAAEAQTDPRGPASGDWRVIRGGSWSNGAQGCRSAFRDFWYPVFRVSVLGFRVVRRLPPPAGLEP